MGSSMVTAPGVLPRVNHVKALWAFYKEEKMHSSEDTKKKYKDELAENLSALAAKKIHSH